MTPRRLWLDSETYCDEPLKHGVYKYAERAEVMLIAWAIDDEPAQVWDLTADEPRPLALTRAIYDPAVEVWAHNAGFDAPVLDQASLRQRWLPFPVPVHRWRCSMAQALTHGLPGSLDALCDILDVPQDAAKMKDGRRLVHLFCKPLPKARKLRRATRETHPDEWARFKEYAASDINAMRACAARIPTWNYRGPEVALWHLDQQINARGIAVDGALVDGAIAAVEQAQAQLAHAVDERTQGEVTAATQRDKLLKHILRAHHIDLKDLREDTVRKYVEDPNLPPAVRDLLVIRLQAATASTSKYQALKRAVTGGRLRGASQFSGARRTRRWAGRLFQPQNLFRPDLPQHVIAAGIDALIAGTADLVTDDVMRLAANAVRGCLIAAPGRKLVAADLANIEGRAAAWLAGENWKLDAFRAFDAGEGPDLYRVAYARAFAIDVADVTKEQRQIGKVMELMLQYEGGVGAFITGAATYGIDLDDMAERSWESLPPATRAEAEDFRQWLVSRRIDEYAEAQGVLAADVPPSRRAALQNAAQHGLSDRTFVACEALKRLWREAHPKIVATWRDLRNAAICAVRNPGQAFRAGRILARRDIADDVGDWLRLQLPSGRFLCYPSPDVRGDAVTYLGVSQYNRKWSRLSTYGGKLFENACQSLARDVLADNLAGIEAAGYPIVLTVHDEVITEPLAVPEFNAAGLSALLARNASWSKGLPLAASGFEANRYQKG